MNQFYKNLALWMVIALVVILWVLVWRRRKLAGEEEERAVGASTARPRTTVERSARKVSFLLALF